MLYKHRSIFECFFINGIPTTQCWSVITMLLALYSMGTISAILESWTFTFFLCMISFSLFMIYYLFNVGHIKVKRGSLLWLVPVIVCAMESTRTFIYLDIAFYIVMASILIVVSNTKKDAIFLMFGLFIIFSLLFAFGEFWQLFNEDLYYKYIYPLFPPSYQISIKRQFYYHKMCTGFTAQTVVSAEYILLGLSSLYCFFSKFKNKFLPICMMFFLSAGLLLTGKRSPLLLVVISIMYTELISTRLSKRVIRLLEALIIILLLVLLSYYIILPRFAESRNSIVRLFEYLDNDTDVSNGRFYLWSLAINGFTRRPIIGNGWGWYNNYVGVNGAHNIYLQLLCECGLVGAVPVILVIVTWYYKTRVLIRKHLHIGDIKACPVLKFAHITQVYIILYGLVGNPIYDMNFLFWYIISIGLIYNRYLENDELFIV